MHAKGSIAREDAVVAHAPGARFGEVVDEANGTSVAVVHLEGDDEPRALTYDELVKVAAE